MKMNINSNDFRVPARKELNLTKWPTSQAWLTLPTRDRWLSSKTVPFAMDQPKGRWLQDVQSAGRGPHLSEGVYAARSPANSYGA